MRQKVLGGFDDLIAMFSDVELFLGTFPGDENIRNASISITVSTLDAIEKAIRFFTSNDSKLPGRGWVQVHSRAARLFRGYSANAETGSRRVIKQNRIMANEYFCVISRKRRKGASFQESIRETTASKP